MSDLIGLFAHCPECHRFLADKVGVFEYDWLGGHLKGCEGVCKVHGKVMADTECCEHCEYLGGWAEAWEYEEINGIRSN